ncbi:hypothetical protein JR316_0007504 [Psilocybe cubensis]|uniref:Uncharacterized protein n=5 Tax=Psilocybe cubensis TaxID=181762 RepID=A0A8H8CG45_PSICU|nr:hypothetical protein JR316_0011726 [Psilocybe cubensis]XP_047743811.1 hypothetical protein JR316_0011757 [Psilocybe cubensis]XP_047744070.1 hypothetical protein JR316_0012020 [Psilocybe cubensis]XP_047748527.1 hypothetical protein JR316_0007504 [Psilocybe cubensis]KAH9476155.1 hypothetical protein JR316_0011726 [Psilocybe cubensis]KAH9476186.1 hypothetical protein JR316_0011757 [Psilocybe cubensis]KAH9476445.1 hypothetical protein JR316_0012020 [Psilocybe cubensis]KAH9480902.1 hypothetica
MENTTRQASSSGSLVEPVPMAVSEPYIGFHHPMVTSHINFTPVSRSAPPVPKTAMRINWEPRRSSADLPDDNDDPSLAPAPANPSQSTSSSANSPNPDPPNPAATAGPSQTTLPAQGVATAGPSSAPVGTSKVIIIRKPPGEPGRPGSGGFNLEDVLVGEHDWALSDVETLQDWLRREATKTLRLDASYRSQNPRLIERICNKAMRPEHWPVLANYDNCWPVKSALKLILKYKSEASRRVEGRKMAVRVRKAINNQEGSHESSSEGGSGSDEEA